MIGDIERLSVVQRQVIRLRRLAVAICDGDITARLLALVDEIEHRVREADRPHQQRIRRPQLVGAPDCPVIEKIIGMVAVRVSVPTWRGTETLRSRAIERLCSIAALSWNRRDWPIAQRQRSDRMNALNLKVVIVLIGALAVAVVIYSTVYLSIDAASLSAEMPAR